MPSRTVEATSRGTRAGWAGGLLVLAGTAALVAFVLDRQGRVEYDEAHYLERAFFLAHQVEAKGGWTVPRLGWSLLFETPKPPLYPGGLALAALACGAERLPLVLALGVALPFVLLACVVWRLGAEVAGARAGFFALGVLAASPLVLQMASRLMVESTLAAWVTLAGWAAVRRLDRPGARSAELALGAACGLAALTKLLGPLFVGPLVLVAVVEIARREGGRAAARLLLTVFAAATAIAGPWYLRNAGSALDFALFSAGSWPHEDAGAAWTRPARLALAAFGPVLAALLVFALREAWLDSSSRGGAWRDLSRLTAAAALASAAVVVVPRNFDPRFWMPCLGLVAAWGAAGLERLAARWRRGGPVVAVVVALLAVGAGYRLVEAPSASTPWELPSYLSRSVHGLPAPVQLCTLGESPSWNRYKLRLLAELAAIRPRPAVVDLLHEVAPESFETEVAKCGIVFELDPREIPSERSQIRQNDGIESARRKLHQATMIGFELVELSPETWGAPTRVAVWHRSAEAAGP